MSLTVKITDSKALVLKVTDLSNDQVGIVASPPATLTLNISTDIAIKLTTPGPPGPRGVPGQSVTDQIHEHVQSSASSTWIVNHNLGRKPVAVLVRNTGGQEVDAEIVHTSENQLRVYFAIPFIGSALAL